ncbi:MAG: carboxypeptidase regulatory-like domain-containing protein, partial [Acidobacteriaceae bacterium]|nr:carboxypeptidase regulatory-like domain-containing protein [Acidobacteriaceae bacterium]
MTSWPSRLAFFAFTLCVGLAISPSLFAQGTDLGTIRGNVKDASGAVVPNAKVVVTDPSTATEHPFRTNGDGDYEAFGLNPGNYVVTVSAPGFASEEIKGITLSAGAIVSANATLQPSQTQQTIEVTSESSLVNTDDQTISQTL